MTRFALLAIATSLAGCEAPDPADAPAVEILPESEGAPAVSPRAGAIEAAALPQADFSLARHAGGCGQQAEAAAAVPTAGGCGQQAEAAAAMPTTGGCGQQVEARVMPTVGGCGEQAEARVMPTGGGCGQAAGGQVATGGRSSLSATALAQFGTNTAPRRGPSSTSQPRSGSCGQ